MPNVPILTPAQHAFVAAARTATLATIAPDGSPRLVPICFVLDGDACACSPLDEKPKRSADPRDLARVRDVLDRPEVTLLVHRWDEDWTRLGWVRLDGDGERAGARRPASTPPRSFALRAKYPQYAAQAIDARPMLRIAIGRATAWGDLEP